MTGFTKFSTTLLFFTAFILVLCPITSFAYADVRSDDRNLEEIKYFESLNLNEDVNFTPDSAVTRGEFVKTLLDKNGFEPDEITDYPVNFVDIDSDLKPYVEQMRRMGVIVYTPYNNKFEPESTISLRKALEMYMKFEGIPVPQIFNENDFTLSVKNIGTDAFFAPLIARAVKLNLVEVKNKRLDVFAPLTKRQMAFLIYHGDGLIQKFDSASDTPVKSRIVINVDNGVSKTLTNESTFKIFEDVWDKVLKYYYGKDQIDRKDLLYGAIEGMVDRLGDSYSVFLEPEMLNELTDTLSNEIEGIGASLNLNDEGKIEVVAPLPGSPAEKAGILPGDIIIKVNGQSVENASLSDVVSKIKGPAGTKVDITVLRNGVSKVFSITRSKIKVTNVTTQITSDGIAIITIRNFGAGTPSEVSEFINQLDIASIKGVVVDLRSNPGGYLNSAVAIAEHFTNKGETIVQVVYADKSKNIDKSKVEGVLANKKIAVLINGGSASASEILAATIRDNANSILIGEKTYGKGTVQELTSYTDDSSLKLTIAHWLTPKGVDIDKVGILPQIKVVPTDTDRANGNDPVLNQAIIQLK